MVKTSSGTRVTPRLPRSIAHLSAGASDSFILLEALLSGSAGAVLLPDGVWARSLASKLTWEKWNKHVFPQRIKDDGIAFLTTGAGLRVCIFHFVYVLLLDVCVAFPLFVSLAYASILKWLTILVRRLYSIHLWHNIHPKLAKKCENSGCLREKWLSPMCIRWSFRSTRPPWLATTRNN